MPLPLQGRRILVLRSRDQASVLSSQLAALGATPILIPALEITPLSDTTLLDAALTSLPSFDLLLLTSPNTVPVLADRLAALGLATATLPRVAAIGPSTAAALRQTALSHDPPTLPPVSIAESLSATLLPEVGRLLQQQGSARILLVRAEQARDLLPDQLRSAGADVTVVPAYRNTVPPESAPALAALFSTPASWPHAIPFTSSSSVTHLINLLSTAGITLPPTIPRISIGPVTSATLREHTLPPHAEASQPTVAALVEAVQAALAPPTSRSASLA